MLVLLGAVAVLSDPPFGANPASTPRLAVQQITARPMFGITNDFQDL